MPTVKNVFLDYKDQIHQLIHQCFRHRVFLQIKIKAMFVQTLFLQNHAEDLNQMFEI